MHKAIEGIDLSENKKACKNAGFKLYNGSKVLAQIRSLYQIVKALH